MRDILLWSLSIGCALLLFRQFSTQLVSTTDMMSVGQAHTAKMQQLRPVQQVSRSVVGHLTRSQMRCQRVIEHNRLFDRLQQFSVSSLEVARISTGSVLSSFCHDRARADASCNQRVEAGTTLLKPSEPRNQLQVVRGQAMSEGAGVQIVRTVRAGSCCLHLTTISRFDVLRSPR
jgi:hypothetical protein